MTLYSFRKAAQRLGIDRTRLARWVHDGLVKVVYLEHQPKIPATEIHRIETEGVGHSPKRGRKTSRRAPPNAGNAIRDLDIA